MVDNRDGTFWALPDNGFGAKAQLGGLPAADLPGPPAVGDGARRARGDRGASASSPLRDPDHVLDFDIVNDATPERLLTGADFDIESWSSRQGRHASGSVRSSGRSCCTSSRPGGCSSRRCRSPTGSRRRNPYLAAGRDARRRVRAAASRRWGAAATAGTSTRSSRAPSPTTPTSAAAGSTSSTRAPAPTPGRRWAYQTDQPADVIGDAFMTGRDRMLLIERDDFEGPAVIKRVYEIDLTAPTTDGLRRRRSSCSTPSASRTPT